MAARPMKISKEYVVRRRSGRYMKRVTSKWHRRQAKRDPENAPRRSVYFGWDD